MSDLTLNLNGKAGAYQWTIGLDGEPPLVESRVFKYRREMRDKLVRFIQSIQSDAFMVFDYTDGNAPLEQSQCASIVRLPGSKDVWQVLSVHGWVLQVPGPCECKKNDRMVLYEAEVRVGHLNFTISRKVKSPVGCDIYVVKPAVQERPAKKGKKND